MRGAHIDRALRELGWLIQTGVHDVKDQDGNPVERHIEDMNVEMPDGNVTVVSVFAREGAAGLRELTETGAPFFMPLERIKTERVRFRATASGEGGSYIHVLLCPKPTARRILRFSSTRRRLEVPERIVVVAFADVALRAHRTW